MPSFRDDIRRAIFTKVADKSADVMQDAIKITKMLEENSKRYKNFDKLERVNIEITVPIRLPPNGKKGDCKAVVEEVKKSLNELGGGTTTYHAEGSWLDKQKNVVSDDCVVVFTAMPIGKWFECIPVLQRLIRDEIQSKLFQECVFLRIDNQTFADPLNPLGKETTDKFPSIDEFGRIDAACFTNMKDYEENPIHTVIEQRAHGDGNTQIAGEDVTAAIGNGAIASKGNVQIHKHGIDPKEYAELLAEKLLLEKNLDQMKVESDEQKRQELAEETVELADDLLKNEAVEFDAWGLIELGDAAELAGQLELAEGYNKQALRKFIFENDRGGEAASLCNLGNITGTRGDLDEAERLYRESLAIDREIGDRQGEAASLGNLGNIATNRGDLEKAGRLIRDSLATMREIGDQHSEAVCMNNLGNLASIRGDYAEAERLYRESLAIRREIVDRQGEAALLTNLGNIAQTRGDLAEAERLCRESLATMREIGDRQGEAKSLGNLGNIAQTRGDFADAERLQRESLAIRREIGDREGEAISLSNLGNIVQTRGNISDAERLQRESLAIRREIGDRKSEAGSLINLGNIAQIQDDLAEAERLYRERLAIVRRLATDIAKRFV